MSRTKEVLEHNVDLRLVRLLKVSQPLHDRSGLLGQNAIRGLFAKPGKLWGMNGRMVIEIRYKHDLIEGQYYIQGNSLKASSHSGFFPTDFNNLQQTYDRYLPAKRIGISWPGKFALFCYDCKVIPDLAECSKVLDVIARDFRDCDVEFFANERSETSPITITVTGLLFKIQVYCLPYPYCYLEVDEGSFQL